MRPLSLSFLVSSVCLALAAAVPARALTVPPAIEGKNLVDPAFASLRIELPDPDRVTVVVFLSARCPCSRSHEPVLAALSREFAKEARFIGIHSNSDEPVEESSSHFKKTQLPFAVIQDREARLADSFNALKTPHAFVLGPKGDVLFQGGVDNSHESSQASKHYLKNALLAVRAGRQPEITLARSLGCQIRR